MVLNGTELGSGSLRNHRADIQRQILEIMGYAQKRWEELGFMLEALETGAPPHGGFARFRSLGAKLIGDNLRDVIAFLKTAGQLMEAPSGSTQTSRRAALRVVAGEKG